MKRTGKISLVFVVMLVVCLVLAAGCAANSAEQTASQPVQNSEQVTASASADASSESAASPGGTDYSKYKIGSTANNVGTDAYQTMHDKTLCEALQSFVSDHI